MANASSRGRPLFSTALRKTRSMVAVLPAMVSVPATLATPPTTSTANEPRWYEPSSIPAAAMASVISAMRSEPASRFTNRYSAGCRCTPSLISSTVTRGSSIRATTGPGSR